MAGSLAELGRGRWLAEPALRTCAAGGSAETALLDERLPASLPATQPELARRLATVVLGGVLGLPHAERESLLGRDARSVAGRGRIGDGGAPSVCTATATPR